MESRAVVICRADAGSDTAQRPVVGGVMNGGANRVNWVLEKGAGLAVRLMQLGCPMLLRCALQEQDGKNGPWKE
jgi:hypothetical protein